jgi:hypothetical protein
MSDIRVLYPLRVLQKSFSVFGQRNLPGGGRAFEQRRAEDGFFRICWLTVDCVRWTRSAARVKERDSTTATKL